MAVDTSNIEAAVRAYAVTKLADLADEFVDTAKAGASRRTGELVDGIGHDTVVETGNGARCTARSEAEHSKYQDEGTGIYGPDGAPITPKNGSVLVFDWPAAGGVVFARSVRGSEPTRFWTKALEAWPSIVSTT